MENRRKAKFYPTSASIMLIVALLLLTGALLPTSKAVLVTDSVTGAIWTTDPNGERVNGNLYTNAKNVYLTGGPHRIGAAGLPDGIYYFQVTDPPGKTLLSTDSLESRKFEVKDGYTYGIDGGTHKWNLDTSRGQGIVVQLWPFTFTPNKGGVYKVWVTKTEHYTPGQGTFGFISSLSKTDNFKVKLNEVPKYFELWVTDGISAPPNMAFYVNYTIDGDKNPSTFDPVNPWTTGQLIWDQTKGCFRYETSFALDTYIYWKFFMLNAFTWASNIYGPELINQAGMINKETLFLVNGHKYNYRDYLAGRLVGLEGWTIELYRDGNLIGMTQTDPNGYYEFFGVGTGNYVVGEVLKADEGWVNATQTSYEFTVDGSNGSDLTYDFYNYKIIRISDTSDSRYELSSFDLVFTPSNEGPNMYKLSSTNPGSFYYNVAKYGTPGTNVTIQVNLPDDPANGVWYDSPNFILHHTYIGSTPVVDVHVYAGRLDSPSSEWVPDWNSDITNLFNINAPDAKHVTVEGKIPYSGQIFVTVHIDYQISASLTWDQVQSFSNFNYVFGVVVINSVFGGRRTLPVGSVK